MPTASALLAVLEDMNQMLDKIDGVLGALEQRAKNGGKRRGNQMDLFSGAAPVEVPAPVVTNNNFDPDDAMHRLNRAIAQIETVLHAA